MKYRVLLKIIWTITMIVGMSCLLPAQQDSITIEKALDLAEENNPSLKNSKLNLERAQLNLVAQRASLKSRFTLDLEPISYDQTNRFDNRLSQWYDNKALTTGGSFSVVQPILPTDGTLTLRNNFNWQDNRSTVEGKTNQNKAFTNSLFLRLDQPIFTYNTRKMVLKRLEIAYENSGISYALERLRTEANITQQFYAVYMAQNNLVISKEELENVRQSYEIIKNKVEADLSAKEELYQAEVNFASAQSDVREKIASLEDAKDALKLILGISLNEDIQVKADIEITPVVISLEQAVNNGMASRMELRQREMDIEESDLRMIEIKAMNEFKGNVSLSVGITGVNGNFANIYDSPTQNPRVALSFSVPIFDWGEKKARVNAQKTAQTIAKLNYENQKNDIEINIRQVLREIEKYYAQIDIAEKNVRNAQLTYDLNLTRYREGDLTGMQISQFQTQLSTKKIAYSLTLINYKKALLSLKILTLYDFENGKPVVPVMGLEN
jgi:outer membrane protein TolC